MTRQGTHASGEEEEEERKQRIIIDVGS